MRITLSHSPFVGFGPSRYAAGREPQRHEIELPRDNREARRLVRQYAPVAPGIYGMVDGEGQLIYVGKSKALRHRLLSYFAPDQDRSKSRNIIDRTRRLTWEPAPHEFLALLRELELIRRYRPRFNVRGQPGRWKRRYLCLGRGPAPYAYLAPRPTARDLFFFGPLPSGPAFRDAVHRLNDCFRLRDCPESVPIRFSDELELFSTVDRSGCLRCELDACTAPCIARCSQADYGEQLDATVRFLEGADRAVVENLEKKMRQAAECREFERAAALRNAIDDLRLLDESLDELRTVRRHYSFVYPLPGYGGRVRWVVVEGGQIHCIAPAPWGVSAARRCLALLEAVFFNPPNGAGRQSPEDLEVTQLVALWFRTHPEQLRRVLLPSVAMARCQGRLERRNGRPSSLAGHASGSSRVGTVASPPRTG